MMTPADYLILLNEFVHSCSRPSLISSHPVQFHCNFFLNVIQCTNNPMRMMRTKKTHERTIENWIKSTHILRQTAFWVPYPYILPAARLLLRSPPKKNIDKFIFEWIEMVSMGPTRSSHAHKLNEQLFVKCDTRHQTNRLNNKNTLIFANKLIPMKLHRCEREMFFPFIPSKKAKYFQFPVEFMFFLFAYANAFRLVNSVAHTNCMCNPSTSVDQCQPFFEAIYCSKKSGA